MPAPLPQASRAPALLMRATRPLAVMLRRWFCRASQAAVLLTALYFFALYCFVFSLRARFPFDLEWMEGGMVDEVRYFLAHGQIYVEPSFEFVPFIYNPVYFWVCGLVAKIIGIDWFALRLVSIVASLVVLALLFRLVQRETRSLRAGIVSAGLYAATFAIAGAWADLARVDSLYLAFLVGAAVLARWANRPRELVLSGVLLALAFGTKQSAALLGPALALYLYWFRGFKAALWFALPAVVLSLGGVLLLNVASHGWYWFYAVFVPSRHESAYLLEFWKNEFIGPLALALGLGVKWLLERGTSREAKAFYVLVGGTFVVIGVVARGHTGSYYNDDITLHAALTTLAALGLAPYLRAQARSEELQAIAACWLVIAQFALLRYSASTFVPTQRDREAAASVSALVRSFDGEVLLPYHGNVAAREGKSSYAHGMALLDINRVGREVAHMNLKLGREIMSALAQHRFAAIITDTDDTAFMARPTIASFYDLSPRSVVPAPPALFPKTGLMLRPSALFVPRNSADAREHRGRRPR